jgi:hypothetical protein
MNGHGNKLNRTQELAIAALLSCRTIKAAAKRCGIDESSLRGWLRLPEFVAEYRAARREIVDSAICRIQAATDKAVRTLERNLKGKRPSDEIRAATVLLEFAVKAVDQTNLLARIEALEGRQK